MQHNWAGTRAPQATSAVTLCDQVACDPRRAVPNRPQIIQPLDVQIARAVTPGIPLRGVDGPRLLDGAAQQLGRHRTGRPAWPASRGAGRAARGSRPHRRRRRRGQARRGRGDVRVPGQASRPPFGARLGVLAVPADVGAGLTAVGHQQAGRERDPAQRALGRRQGTVAVVTLRSHRRIPPRELAAHRRTASSSDAPDRGITKADAADVAIAPPTMDTGHGDLRHLRYDEVLQSGVARWLLIQVSHIGPDDSGKAAKFFSSSPKATQTY
jgi:hypothetical protein